MKRATIGRFSTMAPTAERLPLSAERHVSMRWARSWSVPYAAILSSENPKSAVSSVYVRPGSNPNPLWCALRPTLNKSILDDPSTPFVLAKAW